MTSRHRYAELHAHSAYSFLDGANEPDELASAAVEFGVEALALTDHDGVPGIVKHAQAGRAHGLPTIHGTELTLADGSGLDGRLQNLDGDTVSVRANGRLHTVRIAEISSGRMRVDMGKAESKAVEEGED